MESKGAFWVKWASGLVVFVSWIIFFSWKNNNPETSITTPILITIGLTIAGIFAYIKRESLLKKIANEEKKDETPPEIPEEQRHEMLRNIAHNVFWNNIRRNQGIKCINDKSIQGYHIYAYKVGMNLDNEWFVGIINANDPQRGVTVIDDEKKNSEHYIEKRMNSKAESPELEEKEERTETDLKEGKTTTYSRTKPKEKEKPKEDQVA